MKDAVTMTTHETSENDAAVFSDSIAMDPAVESVRASITEAKEPVWLVAAMIVVAMGLRPGIASIGPVLPVISRAFMLSHGTASLLATVPILLMGLLPMPSAWLASRFGRGEVLLISLVVLAISMAARTFASNVCELLLTTAGVGTGIAVAGTLFAGLIKSRFPTRVAIMMSIYATSLSLSSAISAAATGPIAAFGGMNGWRVGTGIWTVIALLAVFAGLAIFVRERRPVRTLATRAATAATAASAVPLPLSNRTAWLIALFFAFDNFLFFAFLSWISAIYVERGLSAVSASLVLATFTVAFTVGMPVFGSLSRTHDRRGWLAVCAALTATGLLGLALVPLLMPHVWVAVGAFGLGGGFTLGMTLPIDNAQHPDEVNAWNAFMMTVGYLLAATGPLLFGVFRDLTGSFNGSVWLAHIVALAMLALTPFLAPHAHDAA